MNAGQSPIVEPGLGELIDSNVAAGRLRATHKRSRSGRRQRCVACLGSTPSRRNGSLDLIYLTRVCEELGEAIRDKRSYHVIVIRSTVLPGTTHETVIPTLERTSGKKYGEGFGVSVNPEFLREGSAVKDIKHPPLTLVGHNHAADAARTVALYDGIDAPLVSTSIRVAEMIKYTSNAWHALKVCFGNEIGNLCKRLDVDSHDVMDTFCQDHKLNLSSYYLKPGFAFGGSCLPKDLRALEYRAKELDLELPVLNSVLRSNALQIQHALEQIVETGRKRVGLLGFSFKAGTDDLRESPMVILAETLLGKGHEVRIFDRNVLLARLTGSNKDYIEKQIPHLAKLLCESADEVIAESDVVVIGNAGDEFGEAMTRCRSDQTILDLVRVPSRSVQDRCELPGYLLVARQRVAYRTTLNSVSVGVAGNFAVGRVPKSQPRSLPSSPARRYRTGCRQAIVFYCTVAKCCRKVAKRREEIVRWVSRRHLGVARDNIAVNDGAGRVVGDRAVAIRLAVAGHAVRVMTHQVVGEHEARDRPTADRRSRAVDIGSAIEAHDVAVVQHSVVIDRHVPRFVADLDKDSRAAPRLRRDVENEIVLDYDACELSARSCVVVTEHIERATRMRDDIAAELHIGDHGPGVQAARISRREDDRVSWLRSTPVGTA